MPKLSVISGAYNASAYPHFKESIESVLEQSFEDFEFIIFNDGSTDSTESVLREYERLDSRIKILTGEENRGLGYALNQCIKISKIIAKMFAFYH